jgi:uncharacterized ion transporter superfamily protein YfcC
MKRNNQKTINISKIIFFVLVFASVCSFLFLHIRKITKNPTKSLTYEMDQKKLISLDLALPENTANENKIFKTFAIFFTIQLVALILIASIRAISSFAIPILAVSFLFGGIICGLIIAQPTQIVIVIFPFKSITSIQKLSHIQICVYHRILEL